MRRNESYAKKKLVKELEASMDMKLVDRVDKITERLLSSRKETERPKTPTVPKSQEEIDLDSYMSVLRIKLLKLPAKKREEVLDKCISFANDAVTQMEAQTQAVQQHVSQYVLPSSMQQGFGNRRISVLEAQFLQEAQNFNQQNASSYQTGYRQPVITPVPGTSGRQVSVSQVPSADEAVSNMPTQMSSYNTAAMASGVQTPGNAAAQAVSTASQDSNMTYTLMGNVDQE